MHWSLGCCQSLFFTGDEGTLPILDILQVWEPVLNRNLFLLTDGHDDFEDGPLQDTVQGCGDDTLLFLVIDINIRRLPLGEIL